VILGLFLIVPGKPAAAASFDCSKAELPLDKLICATPELSAKDDEMSAKYEAALAILSPEGQGILRNGQRKWVKFVRTYCASRIGQPTDSLGGGDSKQCLASEYGNRLDQLDSAALKLGNIVFSRVDEFQIVPSPADQEGGNRGHFGYCIRGYPRIDAPSSAEAKSWNETWRKWADECASENSDTGINADFEYTFDVHLAQNRLISISGDAIGYFHGAGQPILTLSGLWNIALPSLHPLKAEDLFWSGSAWRQMIIKRCIAALSERLPAEKMPDDNSWNDTCTDAQSWDMRPDKLSILIDLRNDFFWAAGVAEADIPWSDLKPFLAPDAPIKLSGN